MNLDVTARIRPSFRSDARHKLHIDNQNRIGSGPQGAYFTFQHLHKQDASTLDVYRSSVEPLLSLFTLGYNCSLLIVGESGAGKSYNLGGHGSSRVGLVQMLIENLFQRIGDVRPTYDSSIYRTPSISLQMYEVYNENVKDLLQTPGLVSPYVPLDMTAEKGVYVKGGTSMPIRTADDGILLFRQGWANRTEGMTDYGFAQNNASIVVFIDLEVQIGENPDPCKCRFTLAEIAGLEKLVEDPKMLKTREGLTINKSVIALRNTVMNLSRNQQPERVIGYNDSQLTQMLQQSLGGNCKTRALLCMKPHTDPIVLTHILQFCAHLAKVRTFPIPCDSLGRGLEVQYRSQVLDLLQQLGLGPMYSTAASLNDGRDEVRNIQAENIHLQDQNERLRQKLDQMQDKYGNIATSKTDLSHQLLSTEEEKLKVSQSMVELQIEINRLKEEAEATKFELTNKIFQLENELINSEGEREKQANIARNAVDKLTEMEKDRHDLADEYVTVKVNYVAVVKEHEKEVARNEELSMELLNLVNAKATLMNQLKVVNAADALDDPTVEVSRIRSMVGRHTPKRTDEIQATKQDREDLEQSLFGSEQRYQGEITRIHNMYDDNTRKLAMKITSLSRELTEARKLSRDRQQKLSEYNAKIIVLGNDRSRLETQYNRIQHKVKDLNEEYRSRLIKYVQDIASYVDKESRTTKSPQHWQKYIEQMVNDVKKAFKQREDQLGQAAKQYKDRLGVSVRKYEEILTAYIKMKTRMREKGITTDDYSPDEKTWKVNEKELQSSEQGEIRRLKDDLNMALSELDSLKSQIDYNKLDASGDLSKFRYGGTDENWSSLRKQLREFTLNTQQELEKERAELLTENQILGEQLKQNQDYIDKHLVRYKEEIVSLRRKLGMDPDAPIAVSPFTLR